MNNSTTIAINTIIETILIRVNELFAKLLYLCPTLFFITSSQWVDIITCAYDTRSLIFFIVSQIQSYNKRVKRLKKECALPNRLLSDKDMKAFAETIVDILDDIQDSNTLAVEYVVRTHFMADIMKQDWLSNKEFRRGQCISYGISASFLVLNRLLSDIKIKMHQYPFCFVNCCMSSLKMIIDIVKEVYANISFSRTRSKQFVIDLKCIIVGTIDILHILQNESIYNIVNEDDIDYNGKDFLWYGKKQSVFNLDFMKRIIDMRTKCFENGKNNKKLYSVEKELVNKAMFSFNINTTFSEQLDDQSILDVISSMLEVQLMVFILDADNDDIADLIEININDLIIDDKDRLFSLRNNERIGLDTVISMVSSDINNTLQLDRPMQYNHDYERVSKCTINKDILKYITIDPIYLTSILNKNYVCIGEENDFPILNESEISKRMKLIKLCEKIKEASNYVSLD